MTEYIPSLRPFSNGQAAPSGSVRLTCALTPIASQVYVGQLVKLTGTGDALGKYPEVTVMAPGDGGKTFGVITGFHYEGEREKTGQKYIEASATGVFLLVDTDINTEYKVHMSAALGIANVGLNVDIVAVTSVDAFGYPGIEADAGTVASTATLPLRLMGIVDEPGNNITDPKAVWRVRLNNHVYNSDTGA